MRRFLLTTLVGMTLWSSCAVTPAGERAEYPPPAKSGGRDRECSFDSQCFGGSCRLGRCSPFERRERRERPERRGTSPAGLHHCTRGTDCHAGRCRGIHCH